MFHLVEELISAKPSYSVRTYYSGDTFASHQTITYAWKPKYTLAFSVKKLEPNTKIAWIPIEMTRLQKFADTTVNVTSPLHNSQLRERQFIRNGEGRDKKT